MKERKRKRRKEGIKKGRTKNQSNDNNECKEGRNVLKES